VRSGRLLGIVLYLQRRGRATARELADELEVSTRTILRDVEQLSSAGVPVYTERGRGGGIALLDGFRTSLTGLSAGEAEAVAFVSVPSAARQLGLGAELLPAREKILSALPPAASHAAASIVDRFHVDPVDWYRRVDSPELLPEIARALWAGRRITFTYQSWDDRRRRTVDPWGLVIKAGAWYLVAAAGGRPRVYRTARISDLTVGDEAVEGPPPSFRLGEFWQSWCVASERRLRTGTALVKLTAEGLVNLHRIGAHLADHASQLHPAGEAGWTLVELPMEDVPRAACDLMLLGDDVEVLEPTELRREIRRRASAIAARHS
jgi:predicted DNA-binding transcriptional regulator YafY